MIWHFPNLTEDEWGGLFAFLFFLGMASSALYFEQTLFPPGWVTKKDEPVSYWLMTVTYILLATATLFLMLVPTCFDPETLRTSIGSCRH